MGTSNQQDYSEWEQTRHIGPERRDYQLRLSDALLTLTRLSAGAEPGADLSTKLEDILGAACKLVGASRGLLRSFDGCAGARQVVTHGYTREEELAGIDYLALLLEKSGRPPGSGLPRQLEVEAATGREDAGPRISGTFLYFPIRYEGKLLAGLFLEGKLDGADFSPEDETLLALLCAQAALIIRLTQASIQGCQGCQGFTGEDRVPAAVEDLRTLRARRTLNEVPEREKLRKELLGMVTHALRKPVATIKGSVATILGSKRSLDPEEVRYYCEVIEEEADRLKDLVGDLLDDSRTDAGAFSREDSEPPDLAEITGFVATDWAVRGTSNQASAVGAISQLRPAGVSPEGFSPLDTTQRAAHLGKVRRLGERTRILAIDGETKTLQLFKPALKEAGYQVMVTDDPFEGKRVLESRDADLALMDMAMPGISGFRLVEEIREFSGVPIICVTVKEQADEMVRAVELGADGYLTTPFMSSELLARVAATLRRCLLPDTLEARPPFVMGEITVNFSERCVHVGGRVCNLTATEYKILYELVTHAGTVLTYDDILARVWGPEYSGEAGLVRSFVRNLRRKLGDDARRPRFIFNKSQVGYWAPAREQGLSIR